MRLIRLGAPVVAGLSLFFAAAPAQAVAPVGFAAGAFRSNSGIQYSTFSAHGTITNATGHFRFTGPGAAFQGLIGKVRCLAVEGDRALVAGDITSGGLLPTEFGATDFELQVLDGGPGGEDRWALGIGRMDPLEVCRRIRYEPVVVVQQGNVVVHAGRTG